MGLMTGRRGGGKSTNIFEGCVVRVLDSAASLKGGRGGHLAAATTFPLVSFPSRAERFASGNYYHLKNGQRAGCL